MIRTSTRSPRREGRHREGPAGHRPRAPGAVLAAGTARPRHPRPMVHGTAALRRRSAPPGGLPVYDAIARAQLFPGFQDNERFGLQLLSRTGTRATAPSSCRTSRRGTAPGQLTGDRARPPAPASSERARGRDVIMRAAPRVARRLVSTRTSAAGRPAQATLEPRDDGSRRGASRRMAPRTRRGRRLPSPLQ